MTGARAQKAGAALAATISARSWQCRATGCRCRPSPGALFCGRHWLTIPKALRDQISDTAGQRGSTRDPLVIEHLNRISGRLVAQAIDAIDAAQPRAPTRRQWWQE